ncbi:YqaI family protein [Bacillus sp. J33]|uniref:YqaI family protein n=1 Tax=Bacillus sp. J33 TaxID=935836 RepID=UPI0004B28C2E|nr:hypothetical protein [Bacillus sp. J33]
METCENHPVEDVFGDEICSNDVYFIFGNDVVLEGNLKTYLIGNQQVSCYRAV